MKSKFAGSLLCVFFIVFTHAQQRVISGQLNPVISGCVISIKGTTIRAVSDSKGTYTLTIPDSLKITQLTLIYDATGMYADRINLEKNHAFDPRNTVVNLDDPGFQQAIRISSTLQTDMTVKAPSFPFPPPAASALDVIDRSLFKNLNTLGDLNKKVSSALQSLGYFEKSYYAVPDGFALVTRLERRKENEPEPYDPPLRWDVNVSSSVRSISDYLLELFTAPKGFFRVITFIVTDNLVTGDERKRVNRDQALAWFKTGTTVLPSDIAQLPLEAGYDCTVLIYEFEKEENKEARFIVSSSFPGKLHLDRFYKAFVSVK
ncbi:MAG TPA: hypothetical protein VFV68_16810 [Agriterribacter sp.]|nr:hypothetical protein [Agriterribacter sp.]